MAYMSSAAQQACFTKWPPSIWQTIEKYGKITTLPASKIFPYTLEQLAEYAEIIEDPTVQNLFHLQDPPELSHAGYSNYFL